MNQRQVLDRDGKRSVDDQLSTSDCPELPDRDVPDVRFDRRSIRARDADEIACLILTEEWSVKGTPSYIHMRAFTGRHAHFGQGDSQAAVRKIVASGDAAGSN